MARGQSACDPEAMPARFAGVLETCLYHEPSEAEAVERFYTDLLGLRRVAAWPGGIACRIGSAVILLFDRSELARRDDPISAHGTTGPGHCCLLAPDAAEYETWKLRLAGAGVELLHEHHWGSERRSVYFHDPAGNLLEIADGNLWPA